MAETREHDWRLVKAPNRDQGYQCVLCGLTAITLPLRVPIPCPPAENTDAQDTR